MVGFSCTTLNQYPYLLVQSWESTVLRLVICIESWKILRFIWKEVCFRTSQKYLKYMEENCRLDCPFYMGVSTANAAQCSDAQRQEMTYNGVQKFVHFNNNQYIKMPHSFMKQSLQIVFKRTFYWDKEEKACTLGQLIDLWNLLSSA